MAKLKPCKACGNMIANDAKVCPKCGAQNKRGGNGCIVVILVLIVIVAFLVNKTSKAKDRAREISQQVQRERVEAEKAKLAAMTPEQRKEYQKEQWRQQLAKQFADKFERKFDGSIKPVVEYVKNNMKNPNSFEHVKTEWFINKDAERQYIVRMQYRGTNSFNAVVTEQVELVVWQDGTIVKK